MQNSKNHNTLAHTTWNCKYHIVFAPKFRRKVFFGEKKAEIGKILRKLCEWKQVNIVEAEVCPDHVHMLLEIPPKYCVSQHRGVSQGQEQPDALREVSRPATQVPQPRVLVPRLLCRCDWKKHGEDRRVHPKPAEGGQVRGTVDHDG